MTTPSDISGDVARLAADAEVLPPRSLDSEVSGILDELSKLQTWCVMQARHSPSVAISAADLVQRTRILIIERCKASSLRSREDRDNGQ